MKNHLARYSLFVVMHIYFLCWDADFGRGPVKFKRRKIGKNFDAVQQNSAGLGRIRDLPNGMA